MSFDLTCLFRCLCSVCISQCVSECRADGLGVNLLTQNHKPTKRQPWGSKELSKKIFQQLENTVVSVIPSRSITFDQHFRSSSNRLLTEAQCATLMDQADRHVSLHNYREEETRDLKLFLTEWDLVSLLDCQVDKTFYRLSELAGNCATSYILRRCEEHGKCIPFHRGDKSRKIIQVSDRQMSMG